MVQPLMLAEFAPVSVRATARIVLLALPLVLVIPVLFLLAPSRLRYRVGPGYLEVRTLFVRRRFSIFGAGARRA